MWVQVPLSLDENNKRKEDKRRICGRRGGKDSGADDKDDNRGEGK